MIPSISLAHYKRAIAIAVCSVLFPIGGCGLGDSIEKISTISKNLSDGVADFNATALALQDVLGKLPEKSAKQFKSAIEEASTRASQAAGIAARCTTDHLRKRIAADIRYIATIMKASNEKRNPPPKPLNTPIVCQPSPNAITLNCQARPIEARITWDGFDFVDPSRLVLVLIQQNGSLTPIIGGISLSSSYQCVADLTRISNIDSTVLKLALMYENEILSEIPISSPPPLIRETIRATLSSWGPLIANTCSSPRNRNADPEFDSHGPRITYSINLIIQNDAQLWAVIKYHAIEWDEGNNRPRNDFSEACGEWREHVYTAPAGSRILRILDNPQDSGMFIDQDHAESRVNGNLYSGYIIGGDRRGDDVGVSTSIAPARQGAVQIEVERCR